MNSFIVLYDFWRVEGNYFESEREDIYSVFMITYCYEYSTYFFYYGLWLCLTYKRSIKF